MNSLTIYSSHGNRFSLKVLFLAILPITVAAAAEQEIVGEIAMPDPSLLEFLGDFETDSGEWISPAVLMNSEIGKILDASDEAIDSTTEETAALRTIRQSETDKDDD